jgi:hypothetical protein
MFHRVLQRLTVFATVFGATIAASSHHPPHWDLEMTGPEYEVALARAERLGTGGRDAEAQRIVDAGNRLYAWMRAINAVRPATTPLTLAAGSPPGSTGSAGIPIATPSKLSIERVKADFAATVEAMPSIMRQVLVDGATAPEEIPIDDATFARHGRVVEALYSRAARWLLLIPYLDYYRAQRRADVRGYYHLLRTPNLDSKLASFGSLPESERLELRTWLLGLCANSGAADAACQSELDRAIAGGTVGAFHAKMRPHGERVWATFWTGVNPRWDVQWTSQRPLVAWSWFQDPGNAGVAAFLRDNIEEEWRWGNWALRLAFRAGNFGHPYVLFVPGATPHVNALGGGTITLDANHSLESWASRWVIRHEFGHVLGIPDCYVEFYDDAEQAFINYQLDTSDLMCSRAGRMSPRLYDEVRRLYFR